MQMHNCKYMSGGKEILARIKLGIHCNRRSTSESERWSSEREVCSISLSEKVIHHRILSEFIATLPVRSTHMEVLESWQVRVKWWGCGNCLLRICGFAMGIKTGIETRISSISENTPTCRRSLRWPAYRRELPCVTIWLWFSLNFGEVVDGCIWGVTGLTHSQVYFSLCFISTTLLVDCYWSPISSCGLRCPSIFLHCHLVFLKL